MRSPTQSSSTSLPSSANKNERLIMITARMIAAVLMAAASLCPPLHAQLSTDPASAQLDLKKGDRMIVFGDSLTALAVKVTHVPDGKGYVPLVREALKDRGVEVDAVATGGHKVTDLLKRVDQDVLSKK